MSAVLLNLDGMRIIVMFRIVLRWMKNAKAWIKIRHSDGIVTSSIDDHWCARAF